VFLLTREVAVRQGTLAMSVRLGRLDGGGEKHGDDSAEHCQFHSAERERKNSRAASRASVWASRALWTTIAPRIHAAE